VTGKAKGLWAKNKVYIIAGLVGVAIIFIICCCCICRRKMKKKKKKNKEKVKLKSTKPGKKLQRIQPGKTEKKAMEDLGSLKVVLRYDAPSEMLMVTIIEAEDVPVRDLSGYAYSYVVARGKKTESNQKSKGIEVEYKTKLVRAGFWPTFNDTIEFVVEREDLDDEVLDLYLYEMNRWTKHDGIGQVSIELKNLDLSIGKEHILKRKLKPYDPLAELDVEAASIQIGFDYDPDDWKLTVEVIKADIIPADDIKEKLDSYVTLKFLNRENQVLKKLKTKTRRGTLSPEFGDILSLDIPDNLLPDVTVEIKLKASRIVKIGKNPVIGVGQIYPNSTHWQRLVSDTSCKGWFQVTRQNK